MVQKRSLFGPLLLIAAGVVWLLTSQGIIPTSNLWALAHIWPFLLIVAGVGLILRPYWSYTSIALDVLIIGGAVAAILYAPLMAWDNPPMSYTFNGNGLYVGPTEKGSGKMTTQTRDVSNFDVVEVSYPANVFISQGTTESLKVEAEDNLLPGLQTQVRNNTLQIFYKAETKNVVRPTKPVTITIVVKDLKRVDFESAGKLDITGIKTDNFEVSVSGAGDLKLKDMDLKAITVNLSGAGSMTAAGTANDLNLNISGFGSFDGKELSSQTANVQLSGAGSADVRVADTLDTQISGAGSVSYYGSPKVTKQISGVGNVRQAGD